MSKSGNSNAFKHGGFAKHAVLVKESNEEFDELLTNLSNELKPEGALEQETVASIAKLIWAKRRTERMFRHELEFAQFSREHQVAIAIRKVKESLHLATTYQKVDRLVAAVPEPHLGLIKEQIGKRQDLNIPDYVEHVKKVLDSHHQFLANWIFERKISFHDTFLSEKAEASHQLTVKYMATVERLDGMIDRAFKRLFQLKGYKEIVASRVREQISP
jgi:hypothetical protein